MISLAKEKIFLCALEKQKKHVVFYPEISTFECAYSSLAGERLQSKEKKTCALVSF